MYRFFQFCSVAISLSLLLSASINSTIINKSLKIEIGEFDSAKTVSSSQISTEPQLEGIKLSCRVAYVKASNFQSLNAENDPYGDLRNLYIDELVRVINAYFQAGSDEEGLKLFVLGSPRWHQHGIAKSYASQGNLNKAIQVINAAPSGDSAKELEERLELYISTGDPELALKEISSVKSGLLESRKAILLVEVAALFAKDNQESKSEAVLAQALGLAKSSEKIANVGRDDWMNFLSAAVKSYASVGQPKHALKFVKRIRESSYLDREKEGLALADIADGYLSLGEYNQALKVLAEVEIISMGLLKEQNAWNSHFNPTLENHIIFTGLLPKRIVYLYADAREYQRATELSRVFFESNRLMRNPKVLHALNLVEIAKRALKVNDIVTGNRLIEKARILILSEDSASPYTRVDALLKLARVYQAFNQRLQAKSLIDRAFVMVKMMNTSMNKESFRRTQALTAILRAYTALGKYSEALAVAQTEADSLERSRLINLAQCAASG